MHRSVKRQAPRCTYERIQLIKRKTRGEWNVGFFTKGKRRQTPSHLEEYKPGTLCHQTSDLLHPPVPLHM